MICFLPILGSLWHFGPLDPSILGPQMVRGLQPEISFAENLFTLLTDPTYRQYLWTDRDRVSSSPLVVWWGTLKKQSDSISSNQHCISYQHRCILVSASMSISVSINQYQPEPISILWHQLHWHCIKGLRMTLLLSIASVGRNGPGGRIGPSCRSGRESLIGKILVTLY